MEEKLAEDKNKELAIKNHYDLREYEDLVKEKQYLDEKKHEVKHDLDKIDLNKYEIPKREPSKNKDNPYELNRFEMFKRKPSIKDVIKSKKDHAIKRIESNRDVNNFDLKKYDNFFNKDEKKLSEIPEKKQEELAPQINIPNNTLFTGKSNLNSNIIETCYFSNGERYEGEFVDGKFSGKGIFINYLQDLIITPTEINTKANGSTTLEKAKVNSPFKFNQEFVITLTEANTTGNGKTTNEKEKVSKNSKLLGTLYTFVGEKYEGDWDNDDKNGQGSYYFIEGAKYTGDWKNGKRCGRGIKEV